LGGLSESLINGISFLMQQKHVVILLIGLMLVGIVAAGVSSIQNLKNVPLSPTPSPDMSLFNQSTNQSQSSTQPISQNAPQAGRKTTPQQKMMKQYKQFPGILKPEILANKKVIIQTDKGNIEFAVYPEASGAASNFLLLANDGFYDGLTFHRVEPGFVIQGGDPLGNGTGGGKMPTELNQKPFVTGSLGIARGQDINVSNDSQFFITKSDASWLNGQYTNFGQVTKGMDVVNKIAIGDRILSVSITHQ